MVLRGERGMRILFVFSAV